MLIFGFGLIIGSFANAVVWRLHLRESGQEKKPKQKIHPTSRDLRSTSITRGRSMCPKCGRQLATIDLIPVVSWLWLKRKCRYCRAPIAWQYPLVEILMAVLFGLSYLVWPLGSSLGYVDLILWLGVVTGLVILAVYDLRWMLLPDKVHVYVLALAGIQLSLQAVRFGNGALISSVLAAFLIGGFFYALHGFSRGKWMGGGDVKLVFIMGLLLGLSKTLVAVLLAFNSAALISVGLITLKLRGRKDMIPFGPFLIGGTIAAKLYGDQLIQAYLRFVGL